MFELKRKQNLEGIWDPEEDQGDKHRVNEILSTLKALKKYKLV